MKLTLQLDGPLAIEGENVFAIWSQERGDYYRVGGGVATFPDSGTAFDYIKPSDNDASADIVAVNSLVVFSPAHPSVAASTYEERRRHMQSGRDTKRARAKSLARHLMWLKEARAARTLAEFKERSHL